MAIKVSSAITLHVMLHTAMIAASMTSTVSSVQVEGSFSTLSTSKCLTDDQLGKGLFFSFFPHLETAAVDHVDAIIGLLAEFVDVYLLPRHPT